MSRCLNCGGPVQVTEVESFGKTDTIMTCTSCGAHKSFSTKPEDQFVELNDPIIKDAPKADDLPGE
jgi:hypothetical protein